MCTWMREWRKEESLIMCVCDRVGVDLAWLCMGFRAI